MLGLRRILLWEQILANPFLSRRRFPRKSGYFLSDYIYLEQCCGY